MRFIYASTKVFKIIPPILLDNMSPIEIKNCINLKQNFKRKILFEISGGINYENISLYSNLGSDFIP